MGYYWDKFVTFFRDAREEALAEEKFKEKGFVEFKNTELVCPYCQRRGDVFIQYLRLKNGISGGKVLGGLLTGGVSLLATGISRKDVFKQFHCDNCDQYWDGL